MIIRSLNKRPHRSQYQVLWSSKYRLTSTWKSSINRRMIIYLFFM